MNCPWLPETIPCDNWALFNEYDEELYQIFKADFIDTQPVFEQKAVKIRFHPMVDGKEQAYFHVTSVNYRDDQDRKPDPRRCERIQWIRAFIENYQCDSSLCDECDGIKVWEEPYKSNQRVYLLLEEEKYMVILERRPQYILLITAYYLNYAHMLEKQLKKYAAYKAERALPK